MRLGVERVKLEAYNPDKKNFDYAGRLIKILHAEKCPASNDKPGAMCVCTRLYVSDSLRLILSLSGAIILTLMGRLWDWLTSPFRK